QRLLHAVVVLAHAAVDQALDAGVGHGAVAGEVGLAAVAVGAAVLAAVGPGVDEAAVVCLRRPRGGVVLALEVLAAADEHRRVLDDALVLIALVRGVERHDVDAGGVVDEPGVRVVAGDVPRLLVHQALDELHTLRHGSRVRLDAAVNEPGDDDAGDTAVVGR